MASMAPKDDISADYILSALEIMAAAQVVECKAAAAQHGRTLREQVALELSEYQPQRKKTKIAHSSGAPYNSIFRIANAKLEAKGGDMAESPTMPSCQSTRREPNQTNAACPLPDEKPKVALHETLVPASKEEQLAPPEFVPSCCSAESPCPQVWTCSRTTKTYYGVRRGRKLGIYYNWAGAQDQVKGFSRAFFRGFKSQSEVENFMNRPSVAGCFGERQASVSSNPPLTAVLKNEETSPAAPDTATKKETPDTQVGDPPVKIQKYACAGCGTFRPRERKGIICTECASLERCENLENLLHSHHLCAEQLEVLRLVAIGRNIFFTGAAGTGKSTLLKSIVRLLQQAEKQVQVVAPSGIAALLLRGKTIHSYAGWTPHTSKLSLKEMLGNAGKKSTWKRLTKETDVLILDEISMVERDTFSRLSAIMCAARESDEPFGGVQILVAGDFYQLPPVLPFQNCYLCGLELEQSFQNGLKDGSALYTCPKKHGNWRDHDKWAFCSTVWTECKFTCRELQQVHRQNDKTFVDLLCKLRLGLDLTYEEKATLYLHEIDFDPEEAIKLYPKRSDVDKDNTKKLTELTFPTKKYHCVDDYHWNKELHPELKNRFAREDGNDPTSPLKAFTGKDRHRLSTELLLKQDMPVLLLHNLCPADGLVNGSRGYIIGFEPFDTVKLSQELSRARKNVGSDEEAETERYVTYKQTQCLKYCHGMNEKSPGWPIVEFENGPVQTIYPQCIVTELGQEKPYSLMSRTQIPLIAGWAITIHKSQGMTLERAVVDVDEAWEHGHSYVALSRGKSLKGLCVRGLPIDGRATLADESVRAFMERTFPTQPSVEHVEEEFDGDDGDDDDDIKVITEML
ncbi:hypothetical protein Q7P37_002578 [Cladosporium fusiforme]